MIKRFSLYGFLKNLRFFEPFFLLFLREKGLSFFEIGFLFSFREIAVNIMEVPSGAFADLYGRKSVMLISLSSYIVSFLMFGLADSLWVLYCAMVFFAVGEAFRTGTHKAMIFDWLKKKDMVDKKTQVYGYTRSWSQMGSALSVILGSALVFYSGKYTYVFWFSIIPYLLGLWNMASYPDYLNAKIESKISVKGIYRHLIRSFGSILKNQCNLRYLIGKSMIFSGTFKAVKDYLQVLIKVQVLAIPLLATYDNDKRTAILIGIVYFVLYLLNSVSSKNAYKLADYAGSKEKASMYAIVIAIFVMILGGLGVYFEIYIVPILSFVILFNLQNIWKPILLSQIDDCADSKDQATILSVESQSVSFAVFLIAPVAGFMVDNYGLQTLFYLSAGLLSWIYLLNAFPKIFIRKNLN